MYSLVRSQSATAHTLQNVSEVNRAPLAAASSVCDSTKHNGLVTPVSDPPLDRRLILKSKGSRIVKTVLPTGYQIRFKIRPFCVAFIFSSQLCVLFGLQQHTILDFEWSEVGLKMVWISNRIWNMETQPFEIRTQYPPFSQKTFKYRTRPEFGSPLSFTIQIPTVLWPHTARQES